jgi:metal-responsive CopG/Arc/MetJ family transcriptional regulator
MPNDGMMFIRLPHPLLVTITERARTERLSRSELVRRALIGYVCEACATRDQPMAETDTYVKRVLRKGLTYMSGNSLKRNTLIS